VSVPGAAADSFRLFDGVVALTGGMLWLERSRALVAADVHLAYEDVIGGALPLWSTAESTQALLQAARRMQARETILLGDVIHGSRMSDGAAAAVVRALDLLRAESIVTLISGNHEGRTRGAAVLGDTEDAVERDGWLLLHGDEPVAGPRSIVGHLHPSLPLGGEASVPVFLSAQHLIVVPALTPYSSGLNVLGSRCTAALRHFGATSDFEVVATTGERVYPFGSLAKLRGALRTGNAGRPPPHLRRRLLRGDALPPSKNR
jgi:metallophosphoesterase superfamily enzyme